MDDPVRVDDSVLPDFAASWDGENDGLGPQRRISQGDFISIELDNSPRDDKDGKGGSQYALCCQFRT